MVTVIRWVPGFPSSDAHELVRAKPRQKLELDRLIELQTRSVRALNTA